MLTGLDKQIWPLESTPALGTEHTVTNPSINTPQNQEGNSTTHSNELLQVQREMMWFTQKQRGSQGSETGKQNIVCCMWQTGPENRNLHCGGDKNRKHESFPWSEASGLFQV